nr:MAG: hypothetical protein [Porcellio scaber clopovirus]
MHIIFFILILNHFSPLLSKNLVNNSTIDESRDSKLNYKEERETEIKNANEDVDDDYNDYVPEDENYDENSQENENDNTSYIDNSINSIDDNELLKVFQMILQKIMDIQIFESRIYTILGYILLCVTAATIIYISIKKRKFIPLLFISLKNFLLKKEKPAKEDTAIELEAS